MQKFYNLAKASGDGAYDLYITGTIGDEWDNFIYEGNTMEGTVRQLLSQLDSSVKTLNVYINSPGGVVTEGIAIYYHLKAMDAKVRTIITGHASSIASIIFLAGEERIMPDGTFSLVHLPWNCGCGNKNDLQESIQLLDTVGQAILDIYASVLTIPREDIYSLLEKETAIKNDMALEIGFATGKSLSGTVDNSTTIENRINEVRNYLDYNKTCYAQVINNNNEVKNMSEKKDDTKLQDEIDMLKAKLSAAEAAKDKAEAENTELKTQLAAQDIEAAELKGFERGIAEAKSIGEIKARAIRAGFKAEGDTSKAIMQAVLKQAEIKEGDKFDGDALTNLFDYVLKINASKEADDEFADLVDDSSTKDEPVKKPTNVYAGLNKKGAK